MVLNAAALGIAVAEEDELLLLPRPKATDTLSVHLQGGEDAERKADGGGRQHVGSGSEYLGPQYFGLKLS